MYAKLFRFGRWKLLVSRPHDWAFGHVGIDILHSFHEAKAQGARLYLLPPSRKVNKALYEIESPEVQVVPQSTPLAPVIRFLWDLREGYEAFSEFIGDIFGANRKDFLKWVRRYRRRMERTVVVRAMQIAEEKGYANNLRAAIKKRIRARWAEPDEVEETDSSKEEKGVRLSLYRRSLIRHPLSVRFSDANERLARDMAVRAGIPASAKIVTVHIRESGFKHLGGHEEAPFDVARNSRFDNYDRAFDLLLSRGYAVVRIGDPMMTPLRRQGVIDLATSPHRNDLLELWCLAKSSFHLGCDSGPGAVCLLLNTPTVLVNTTNPINTYPVRAGSIYIMKHAVDRQSGRELSLTDMLTEEYLANWRTTRRYKYIDNSAEEIYLAVQEMLEIVDGAGAETPEQAEYRRRVYEAVESLKPKVGYIRKWGTDDEFLGDGRICRFFAERHLHPQEPPAPARESGGELAGSVVR